ncbi:MAG: alpha/beta fold hydrolase [Anaerolineales bacterium]
MLHGLGSRGEDWIFQIEALEHDYRVVTPDLRGHGSSPSTIDWPTMGDLAADVLCLLDQLGERRAHFVGLSLGGGVALQMGLDYPDRVKSLTIVNAAATLRVPRNRLPSAFVRMALLLTGRRKRLGEWVADGLFPREDQTEIREVAATRIAENLRRNYLQAIVAILRFDLRKQVHLIQAPTLVVAGMLDDTVPISPKVALASAIPGARLEVIDGSGHATPLDAPEEFNRLLREFLGKQSVKASNVRDLLVADDHEYSRKHS